MTKIESTEAARAAFRLAIESTEAARAAFRLAPAEWDRRDPDCSDRAWFSSPDMHVCIGYFIDYGPSRGALPVLAVCPSPAYGGSQEHRDFANRDEAMAWIEAHEATTRESILREFEAGRHAAVNREVEERWRAVRWAFLHTPAEGDAA